MTHSLTPARKLLFYSKCRINTSISSSDARKTPISTTVRKGPSSGKLNLRTFHLHDPRWDQQKSNFKKNSLNWFLIESVYWFQFLTVNGDFSTSPTFYNTSKYLFSFLSAWEMPRISLQNQMINIRIQEARTHQPKQKMTKQMPKTVANACRTSGLVLPGLK